MSKQKTSSEGNSSSESDSSGSRVRSPFRELGLIIVGPSSSHTAGPARLGKRVYQALNGRPLQARVTLFNSFARVWFGHGTKGAIVAGLLGHDPSSPLVAEADDDYAQRQGLDIKWVHRFDPKAEPNTLEIEATKRGKIVHLRGVSIGGGRVKVEHIEVREVSDVVSHPAREPHHIPEPSLAAAGVSSTD